MFLSINAHSAENPRENSQITVNVVPYIQWQKVNNEWHMNIIKTNYTDQWTMQFLIHKVLGEKAFQNLGFPGAKSSSLFWQRHSIFQHSVFRV